jgi:hypothetical protein
MLILSAGTVVVVVGAVVVVVAAAAAAPGLAVVVVGAAVVVVVEGDECDPRGAWAAVSVSIAFCTFLLIWSWLAGDSLFRSDWTLWRRRPRPG